MRNALLYVVLVGGSALCVAGLLALGGDLKAPQSVGGTWSIEAAATDSALPECRDFPFSAKDPAFTISQSGPRLELQFNDPKQTDLKGGIEGSIVRAETTRSPARGPAVRLEGSVERRPEGDRITGVLVVPGCSAKFPIVASRRRSAAQAPGGGH